MDGGRAARPVRRRAGTSSMTKRRVARLLSSVRRITSTYRVAGSERSDGPACLLPGHRCALTLPPTCKPGSYLPADPKWRQPWRLGDLRSSRGGVRRPAPSAVLSRPNHASGPAAAAGWIDRAGWVLPPLQTETKNRHPDSLTRHIAPQPQPMFEPNRRHPYAAHVLR